MTGDAEALLHAALQLPDDLRVQLAERLLESVDPEDAFDSQWEAELLRRSHELDDGTDPGISWSELKDQHFGRRC